MRNLAFHRAGLDTEVQRKLLDQGTRMAHSGERFTGTSSTDQRWTGASYLLTARASTTGGA
jgi:hypothetical protein